MQKRNRFKGLVLVLGIIFLIGILGFVFATPPTWIPGSDTTNYSTAEDSIYYHDFSLNITGFNNDVIFDIDSEKDIVWTNVSGTYNVSASDVSAWIRIIDSDTGNFSINSTYDNQTGFFVIPIQATNTSGGATTTEFEFIINATNDAPNFTNIQSLYTNISNGNPFAEYLNATDEESHYPLKFNITFNATNCTHAQWAIDSGDYQDNQNCSLYDFGFTLTSVNNVSALMSFTPTNNHAGVYYANVSVMDYGENYSCPHDFCDNITYMVNQTYYYSQMVRFEIVSSLSVNVSDCNNSVFDEGSDGTCNITIYTKENDDDLNISTYANLRNYAVGQSDVVNTSWFYSDESGTASNYAYNVTINVTPTKTEVGNWTINFTVDDDNGESVTEQIYIFVNRTAPITPSLVIDSLPTDNITSVNQETFINLSVYDDDFLIPDKDYFDESVSFTVEIFNRSTMADLGSDAINDFDVSVVSMPVSGTNRTTAVIQFTPNSTVSGNYTINITANDSEDLTDFVTFNLSIISNSFPLWDNVLNNTVVIWEDNNTYLNLSQNCSDPDGDSLTFSYTFIDGNTFENFDIGSSTGIINFNATDEDVGEHLVNITVSDGYLSNTTTFNFTVYNLNDPVGIRMMEATNSTPTSNINSGDQVNVTEDNVTTFRLWITDEDLKIPTTQKSFYNESFTFNLTISGPNTTLFNFSLNDGYWPQPDSFSLHENWTRYDATFTPRKDDVGNYNVTFNISDLSGNYTVFTFNLTVLETEHAPVITEVVNQSSAVNRTFYLDLNVTDSEDGNDTSGANVNFTFSYTNLTGEDIFASGFNTTTGIFNLTFNDSHEGKYHLNVSVNDSSNLTDTFDFWIFVYGPPNVSYPSAGYTFSDLQENVTSVLNFTVSHIVADNLTYDFYVDGVTYDGSNYTYSALALRNSTNYYGNGTNYSYSFRPTMTDETYGALKNLTLVVYPNSTDLEDASLVNTTINFKLNITHANAPVIFDDNIDNKGPTVYTSNIQVDLKNHFSDADYDDSNYDETVSFTVTSNTSDITTSVSSSWILTLSAASEVTGLFSIFATDGETNATSNEFSVQFTAPAPTGSSSSSTSGGGTTEIPISLKIIMPDPVSAYKKDRIELPLTLYNDGKETLRGIKLNGSIAKDGVLTDDVKINFTQDYFTTLGVGQKQNVTMIIDVDTDRNGTFEITVDANVQTPHYNDWGKMYLTIKEGESIQEKILFTEEFIVDNPECLELKELVDEAKELSVSGRNSEALKKADEAINACKDLISQANKPLENKVEEDPLYRYLIISVLVVFFVGVGFYSYKRILMQRKRGSFLQENIKTKKYL